MEQKAKQYLTARKKHHVIYHTTCLITNKYYIGMHSTNKLDDGYMGSGKLLWRSIKKHGKENHLYEITEHHESRELLRLREAELVNKDKLKDPFCMNLTLGGGDGGWEYHNSNSDIQREKSIRWIEKRKLIELVNPGFNKWFHRRIGTKASATRKANGWKPSAQNLEIFIQAGTKAWTGQKHKAETLKQLSESHRGEKNSSYGTILLHHDILKKTTRISKDMLEVYFSNGWELGAIYNWNRKSQKLAKDQAKLKKKKLKLNEISMKISLLKNIDFSVPGWPHAVQTLLQTKTYNSAKRFVERNMPEIYASAYLNKSMRRF